MQAPIMRFMSVPEPNNALLDADLRYSNMNGDDTATSLLNRLQDLNAPFSQKTWEQSKSNNTPGLPRWPENLMHRPTLEGTRGAPATTPVCAEPVRWGFEDDIYRGFTTPARVTPPVGYCSAAGAYERALMTPNNNVMRVNTIPRLNPGDIEYPSPAVAAFEASLRRERVHNRPSRNVTPTTLTAPWTRREKIVLASTGAVAGIGLLYCLFR